MALAVRSRLRMPRRSQTLSRENMFPPRYRSMVQAANSVPLVNDDPNPSRLLITSLALHVAKCHVVLVNILSESLLRSSPCDYITPLDIPLFLLLLSALARYPFCTYPLEL